MQTNLADFIKDTPEGREADAILRACVHCGFCTATCPTYQVLGDELDGPRGRIYLIKQVLEGVEPTAKTQQHLDRCLTCRNCESTCPSGVQYGRLVDIGRAVVEKTVGRRVGDGLRRRLLHRGLLSKKSFAAALALGRAARPLLPVSLKSKVQPRRAPGSWPTAQHARSMLLLDNCVQEAMAPAIDAAAARVLDRAGITLKRVAAGGCCGALSHHLNEEDTAMQRVRANIDAWWPLVENGAEAIVVTASGCSVMVKDYGHFMQHDTAYAAKAARIAALARDISEVVANAWVQIKPAFRSVPGARAVIAYHPPCTLQHGMKLRGGVETLLRDVGFTLTPVVDSHLCCGSAGTYSVLQSEISAELKRRKLGNLTAGKPTQIATANIGCMTHLQSGTELPVKHWIELLDEQLAP
ncbi:MAG: glycolate oxidase subunit GlcF [Burkholderiales bacterium]|nr:glycolate oxidase subunit GlcF [Burkholderiales bacterium]